MEKDVTFAQVEYKSVSRVLEKETEGKEQMKQAEKQQHASAGLQDSDQSSKANAPALTPVTNSADISSMMTLNPAFNNGIDYSQMMQFMPGNMASGVANFNPMLGKLNMMFFVQTVLIFVLQE